MARFNWRGAWFALFLVFTLGCGLNELNPPLTLEAAGPPTSPPIAVQFTLTLNQGGQPLALSSVRVGQSNVNGKMQILNSALQWLCVNCVQSPTFWLTSIRLAGLEGCPITVDWSAHGPAVDPTQPNLPLWETTVTAFSQSLGKFISLHTSNGQNDLNFETCGSQLSLQIAGVVLTP